MRVRPLFWFLLFVSCISVLIFAATTHTDSPVVMQVHLDQHAPIAHEFTRVTLHLTDPQGLPIDQAHVISNVSMPNMDMGVNRSGFKEIGQGDYIAQLHFSMAGPWVITVTAQAAGFASLQKVVLVQVV